MINYKLYVSVKHRSLDPLKSTGIIIELPNDRHMNVSN